MYRDVKTNEEADNRGAGFNAQPPAMSNQIAGFGASVSPCSTRSGAL